jgi:hypothetical protein
LIVVLLVLGFLFGAVFLLGAEFTWLYVHSQCSRNVTAALEARVVAGDNMYFPDDAHLNEAGQSVVASSQPVFARSLQ